MTDTPEGAERRYPDKVTLASNRDTLDLLLGSKKAGRPHIPTFARKLLRQVVEGGMLYGTATESSFNNLRTVKLDNGQEVFISVGTRRSEPGGYLAVEVVDAPPSDKAILAAMSAKAALPTDIERLRQMLQFIEPPLKDTVHKHRVEALDRFEAEDGPVSPRSLSLLRLYDTYSTLEYIVALLRHHRPGF